MSLRNRRERVPVSAIAARKARGRTALFPALKLYVNRETVRRDFGNNLVTFFYDRCRSKRNPMP